MCQAWRVARRGQASNLSGRKLRPGMTNLYFRDTGLGSANTGSEFSHWSGWALKTVCAVMRTESAGVDLKVDGEEALLGWECNEYRYWPCVHISLRRQASAYARCQGGMHGNSGNEVELCIFARVGGCV